nr:MAG TPA: RNA polymerase I specific transcription initiation factor [Caudoviricetes sp.]DAV65811.1 MAG TPA: RNA polymerase I specific transcription initiation factor [Caudoviricetes sp.]
MFYLNVNNDSGNRNRNISGHLLNAFMMKQGNEQSLLLPVI